MSWQGKFRPVPDEEELLSSTDDLDNCLACMGATGSAIRHTCK